MIALRPSRLPDGSGGWLSQRLLNFIAFEAAWFACILAVAHGHPIWGTTAIAATVAWHVAVSERPASELALVGAMCAVGIVAETIMVNLGFVGYPYGQPVTWLPPYWMVALWGEFAIALNVSLRWLKRRPLLAMALGAIFGPLSFLGGVRLGAARFATEPVALLALAIQWAALMPLVMSLSNRFDGVTPLPGRD